MTQLLMLRVAVEKSGDEVASLLLAALGETLGVKVRLAG